MNPNLTNQFLEVYDTYKKPIRNVLYRLCGERFLDDLVQETFMRIWKSLDRFDQRSSLKTWAYSIAYKTAIDHLRSTKAKLSMTIPWEEKHSVQLPQELSQEGLILAGLLSLSDEHRSTLVWIVFEGCTLEETSHICEVPIGTVKSRLHIARDKMKTFLTLKGVTL